MPSETGSKLKRIFVAKHEEWGKVEQTNWISQQEDGDVWRQITEIPNKAARCYLLDKHTPTHISFHEDA